MGQAGVIRKPSWRKGPTSEGHNPRQTPRDTLANHDMPLARTQPKPLTPTPSFKRESRLPAWWAHVSLNGRLFCSQSADTWS